VAEWGNARDVASDSRILIVDDDPNNRLFLHDTLEHVGFRVLEATGGAECLRRAAEEVPDVILLDVVMPQIDGYEVCRRLKADEKLRDIPILFLTALSQVTDKVRGFEAGGADFITKPFQIDEVLARVRVHVELRRARRDLANTIARLEEMVEQRTRLLVHADRLVTLGTMAAKVLHELKNSLTLIFGNLALTRSYFERVQAAVSRCVDSLASNEVLRQLEPIDGFLLEIEQAAQRIDQTSDGLRRYSRRASVVEFAKVPLSQVVSSAIQLLHARIKTLLRFHLEVPEDLEISCNTRLMEQVFVNLIANAADAVPFSGGTVQISARRTDGEIEVWLRDDGPGIPQEHLQRIFEPFFTTKGEDRGTGLGLVIVQEILRQHGGTIACVQENRRGATFRLTLNPTGLPASPLIELPMEEI
jgi:signal transduction histidine kinase